MTCLILILIALLVGIFFWGLFILTAYTMVVLVAGFAAVLILALLPGFIMGVVSEWRKGR